MVENNTESVSIIKSVLLKLNLFNMAKKYLMYFNIAKRLNIEYKNNSKVMKESIKNLNKFSVPSLKFSKGKQIKELFSSVEIHIPDNGFIFSIDKFKTVNNLNKIMDNMSIDYSKVINFSLDDMRNQYDVNNDYSKNQMDVLDGIEILINREIDALNLSSREDKQKFINFLENIKYGPVSSFEEALQRILFFNQILWQTNHKLNGFGRLDKVLNDIYLIDSISKEKALFLIKEFLKSGHSYYYQKSSGLIGDTGQIIVVGGLEEDNSYFCNDLSFLFIEALSELNIPDPKIILRYSKNIPRDLMACALKCMATGVGSPLISNDDIIVNKLIDFGYKKEDAYNYVVSACWEPAPVGKGLELNNVECLVFIEPLNNLLENEDLNNFNDFDSLLVKYEEYLENYVDDVLNRINSFNWENDPLLSLFIEGCNQHNKDASIGGAFYNNYGLTSVSLSNTVNSLLNIKSLVFDNKLCTFEELNDYRINNFENENILNEIKDLNLKFGKDNDEVINLTNHIINCTDDVFSSKSTKYGGKFKFGLSAPTHISRSGGVKASFDGRKNSDPFNVHISLEDNEDYVELMRFASKLDYSESKFNGNVVDFMVSPHFINRNFEKFLDFLILSLDMGVFQMQLNVVDSQTLIRAKNSPESYPNLIVRVWGFSAYFKDLPSDYQDLLIKRAIENENKNN